MSIAGYLSHKMLEHYSHIRMEAKRAALDAIAKPTFWGTCYKIRYSRQPAKLQLFLTD